MRRPASGPAPSAPSPPARRLLQRRRQRRCRRPRRAELRSTNSASISTTTDRGRCDRRHGDTEDTEVIALADLSITKDDGDGSADDLVVVTGQDSITYSLSIANSGPSDAQGVVVTDTLPAGVTFVGASAGLQ